MKKLSVIYILEISILIFGTEVSGNPSPDRSDNSRTLAIPIPIDSIIAFPTVTTVISEGLLTSTTPIPKERREDVDDGVPHAETDCKTVVYAICDDKGDNCHVEDPVRLCDGDRRSATVLGEAREDSSCRGACRKPSVDGVCLMDPNCCEATFRSGREFLRCLIQD